MRSTTACSVLILLAFAAASADAQQAATRPATGPSTGPSTRRWQQRPPRTYFVAPDGDDAADGSEAKPFRSIQKAADVAGGGDTVRIRGGVYGPVSLTRSGRYFDRFITFQAEPGQEVVIDGSNLERPVQALFDTNGAEYIRLVGLTIRNAPLCGIGVYGSWQVRIENCKTDTTNHSGIIVDKSGFVEVTNSEVVAACNGDNTPMRGGEESVSIKRSRDVLVANNHIHHTGHEGIDVKEGSRHVRVVGNRVHHVQRQGLYTDAWDVPTSDIVFENNVVHDCAFGIVAGSETGGLLSEVWFVNNLVYNNRGPALVVQDWGGERFDNPIDGLYFINNTVVNNGNGGRTGDWGGGMYFENAQARGVVVRNNILANNPQGAFVVRPGKLPADAVIDHNLVFGPPGEALGQATVNGDPMFVNPEQGDFRLRPGSPAIDAGSSELAPKGAADGTARPQGKTVDLGAYETAP